MSNKNISILHISDLHRSRKNPVSNSALLSSILNDIERAKLENPAIKCPEVIIVSGDLIRGSRHEDMDEASKELKEQYEESHEFLNMLVDKLLDGNKDNIIMVPGNHDIAWCSSQASMEIVQSKDVRDENGNVKSVVLEDSINTHSDIKWNWQDLNFYRITNKDLYHSRLAAFSDFYNSFYEQTRSFSLDPKEQYDIFDIPDLNLTIAGFNSCYNNDHLNRAGAIHPDCISNSSININKYKRKGRKLLAVWHHNTKGTPYANDYMESSFIKNLIDSGFIIGFHGHQHKEEIIREENNVVESRKMLVFSSGTLCAGEWELPIGHNRQYNIVNINELDTELEITLHSRQQTTSSSLETPVWCQGNIDNSNSSFFIYKLPYQKIEISIDKELYEIDKMVSRKEFIEASIKLEALDKNNDLVRKYLLRCFTELEDLENILKHFSNPLSIEEGVAVLDAAIVLKKKEVLGELLRNSFIKNSQDPSMKLLKQKAEIVK